MSATPTRDEQVAAGVTAHALISLGLHLSRHTTTLRAPLGVHLPGATTDNPDRLIVHVGDYAVDAWIATVNVTGVHDLEPRSDGRYDARRVDVLLPDSGLRVQLLALYPVLDSVVTA